MSNPVSPRAILLRRVLVGICGLAALVIAGFAWLGYLGGDIFTPVRPSGPMRRDVAAVVLSGDMGFRIGMGPQIAARLAAHGVPVIGVNSLGYFRTTRTPADATALIRAAMAQADTAFGHPAHLMLIGQSYGADMLHVGLAGLPVADRARIAMVALIVPGSTVEYRASPGEVFTFTMDEFAALPTARQIDWTPLLCIRGREETASLCPLLHQANARRIVMPGGHPLHNNAAGVYRQIVAEMARAGLATSPPATSPLATGK